MNNREVISALKLLGDPEIAKHSQRYFKTGKGEYGEGDVFLGIRMPVLRQQVKDFSAISLAETEQLLHSSFHEARILAALMLVAKFNQADDEDREEIYRLYLANTDYINNWDIVDCSAHLIVGPWLDGRSLSPLKKLARSSNLWERRLAMISTLHFIRKQEYEAPLMVATLLLEDSEDLIHKATGWMLREIGNRSRAVEDAFLKAHYQVMPRTMLRYAIEKYPQALRRQYLSGTV